MCDSNARAPVRSDVDRVSGCEAPAGPHVGFVELERRVGNLEKPDVVPRELFAPELLRPFTDVEGLCLSRVGEAALGNDRASRKRRVQPQAIADHRQLVVRNEDVEQRDPRNRRRQVRVPSRIHGRCHGRRRAVPVDSRRRTQRRNPSARPPSFYGRPTTCHVCADLIISCVHTGEHTLHVVAALRDAVYAPAGAALVHRAHGPVPIGFAPSGRRIAASSSGSLAVPTLCLTPCRFADDVRGATSGTKQ